MKLRIDPDFAAVCPPTSDGEHRELEKSILKYGVRDPILHWNGVIVDGMTRYAICQKHGLQFPHKAMQFESRQHAMAWIAANQIGRRNATRQQIKYMWGKYLEGDANFDLPETVEKPAGSAARQAVKFAKEVDRLAPELKKNVLGPKPTITDRDVVDLSTMGRNQQKKTVATPKTRRKKSKEQRRKTTVKVRVKKEVTVEAPPPKKPVVVEKPKDEVPLHPPHLNFVAEDQFIQNAVDALNNIAFGVKKRMNDERGMWLSAGLIMEACERALHALEASKFYAHCPECNGKKGGCDECRCSGWVPKFRYDEIQGLNSE